MLLISTHEKVTFNWVKGHAGHTENERCDELALLALRGKNLLHDVGYNPKESSNENDQKFGEVQRTKSGKVEKEGDPCWKCKTEVVKKPTKKKIAKPGQTYYFEFYLLCPGCKTIYMVEEAKRELGNQTEDLFS